MNRFALGFVLVTLAGCGSKQEIINSEPASPPAVATVTSTRIPYPAWSAVLRSKHREVLASSVGGRVVRVEAREGQEVAAGAVLVQLDHTAADLRIAAAEADVSRVAAELRQAEAEATTATAMAAAGRVARLEAEGASAKVEALRSAQQMLARQVDLARRERAELSLRAERAGTVRERLVEPGSAIVPGQTVLIVEGSGLLLATLYIPITALDGWAPGVAVVDLDEPTTVARVLNIGSGGSNGLSAVLVEVEPGVRRSGDLVRFRPAGERTTVTVPLAAIRWDGEATGPSVLVRLPSGIRRRQVTILQPTGTMVAVSSGLESGATVLLHAPKNTTLLP